MGKKSKRYLEARGFNKLHVREQNVVLTDEFIWILGADAEFDHCEITCEVDDTQFIVSTSALCNCVFRAERCLSNVSWTSAKLKDTRFFGEFSGCDFGGRPDLGEKESFGLVERCDFSGATLDGCRFFNADVRSIKFPSWPCYTIVDREAAAADIGRSRLTERAQQYATISIGEPMEGEVALSLLASCEAKTLGCSEEALREFLQGKAYVL
jgi:hypothetical protein